jgi:hypothetical protein
MRAFSEGTGSRTNEDDPYFLAGRDLRSSNAGATKEITKHILRVEELRRQK